MSSLGPSVREPTAIIGTIIILAQAIFVSMFLAVPDGQAETIDLWGVVVPRRLVPMLASILTLPVLLYTLGALRSLLRQLENGAVASGTWAVLGPDRLRGVLWTGCCFLIPAIYGAGYGFAILNRSAQVSLGPVMVITLLLATSALVFNEGNKIRRLLSVHGGV